MKNIGIVAKTLHWAIFSLCIYAVGCCGLHFFPAWGSSEYYESINNTLLSIALSYIAGYVIFLFTSKWPKKQRELEVLAIWSKHLSGLYNEMSERIEDVRAFAGIPEWEKGCLTEKAVEPLSHYTTMSPVIFIHMEVDRGESEPLRLSNEFSVKKDLNRHHDAVHRYIETMLNNPMAVDADKKLLDVLSRIKTSSFISECSRIIDATQLGDDRDITTSELPKAYIEYVALRDELNKWKFPKYHYKARRMTDEEIEKSQKAIEEKLAQMGTTRKDVIEYGQRLTKASKKE